MLLNLRFYPYLHRDGNTQCLPVCLVNLTSQFSSETSNMAFMKGLQSVVCSCFVYTNLRKWMCVEEWPLQSHEKYIRKNNVSKDEKCHQCFSSKFPSTPSTCFYQTTRSSTFVVQLAVYAEMLSRDSATLQKYRYGKVFELCVCNTDTVTVR